MFCKRFTTKSKFLRDTQRQEILIRLIYQWNQTKRFADEYLAGKLFDQKFCSLLRDLTRSNKRLGRSLLPINTARHARDTTPRTAAGSMGEENEDDYFDDCRCSSDCFVDCSVRSCRSASPSRFAVPRHQRLCRSVGVGDLGLELRWWRIGTGRALIFQPRSLKQIFQRKGRSQATGSFLLAASFLISEPRLTVA